MAMKRDMAIYKRVHFESRIVNLQSEFLLFFSYAVTYASARRDRSKEDYPGGWVQSGAFRFRPRKKVLPSMALKAGR